jgi:hypothetical protein
MNEKEDTVLQISGKTTQFYFPEPNHPALYKSQRLFITLIWFFCVDFPAYSPSSSSPSPRYDFCLIMFLIFHPIFVSLCRLVVWKERETRKSLKKKRNSSYVYYGFRLKG